MLIALGFMMQIMRGPIAMDVVTAAHTTSVCFVCDQCLSCLYQRWFCLGR
jgi:hypothetical protein